MTGAQYSHRREDVFVGREREMAALSAALDDAIAGRGRLVMLVGEPGIGKTRTAAELADIARSRGARVLRGHCHEERSTPPYWPWTQIIRSYAEELGPQAFRSEAGTSAAFIANLLPAALDLPPGVEVGQAGGDPEAARFRLFDSLASFFKRMSRSKPLVLILEDLHWADPASLGFLHFLTADLGSAKVLLLGTYRDTDVERHSPLFRTLGDLTRQRTFSRLVLRGLDIEATISMAAGAGLPPNTRELVSEIHRQTEGNPFFIAETLRLLVQEGSLEEGQLQEGVDWNFRLPDGVREAIGRRLNRLSADCNAVLSLAAVVGTKFEVDILRKVIAVTHAQEPDGPVRLRVIGSAEKRRISLQTSHEPPVNLAARPVPRQAGGPRADPILDSLDEAIAAKLIKPVAGGRSGFEFTHALVKRTLVEEIPLTRRVRIHSHVAAAKEEAFGALAAAHASELAYHFGEAQLVEGPEKLIEYSLLAGEAALAAHAWEEAIAHFHRALAAKLEKGPARTATQPTDMQTAAILFGAGRAEAALDRVDEAVTHLRQAFNFYIRERDQRRAAEVASVALTSGRGTAAMAPLVAEALGQVQPGTLEAGRLLAAYAKFLWESKGDYEGAKEAGEKALAIAGQEGDQSLLMRVLADSCQADRLFLKKDEGARKAARVIEIARLMNSPRDESQAQMHMIWLQLDAGDLRRARAHAAGALAAAERLRDRERLRTACMRSQLVAQAEGDWEAARGFCERALAVRPGDVRVLCLRALMEGQTGGGEQAGDSAALLLKHAPSHDPGNYYEYAILAVGLPLLARITGVRYALDTAETLAHELLDSQVVPMFRLAARCGLALIAVDRASVPEATEQYKALASSRSSFEWNVGLRLDRVLGILAGIIGDLEASANHFDDALAFCRRAGYRPEQAWTCHDYAEMLLAERGVLDRPKVAALLEGGEPIASELGMKRLAARLAGLREKFASRRGARPDYPDGLTEREIEVLRLIAGGKSNAAIAGALVISSNTVARHIANIFAKTGVSNRGEAGAYAARMGLLTG